MKDIFLKIAGVTSEREFYSLYPDEQSFMKKHGKEFKKAQVGGVFSPSTWNAINTGMEEMNILDKYKFTPGTFASDELPVYEQPMNTKNDYSYLKQASTANTFSPKEKTPINWAQGIPIVSDVVKGVQMLKEEEKQLLKASQWEGVSDVMADAAAMKGEPIRRKYLRPEDNVNTGEEFFPIYGVGTNALAKYGKTIAQNGFMSALGQFNDNGGGQLLNSIATQLSGGESAGSVLGGAVGDAIGMIPGVGPIAKMAIKPITSVIGNIIDTNPEKTEKAKRNMDRNITQMMFSSMPTNAYMRTGGNIRQNSNMDGDLQVYDGNAETMSYNPYNGETVMFNGPSHAEGGMDIKYGQNGVEVEGGEPAMETPNKELVVFGDLNIPKQFHPEARGRKFKNYVADISKQEEKQNKIVEKATLKAGEKTVNSSIDKLTINSSLAMIEGANMKLKKFADEKQKLASLQQAINDTAKEMGMNPNSLSKGKLKAQTGWTGDSLLDVNYPSVPPAFANYADNAALMSILWINKLMDEGKYDDYKKVEDEIDIYGNYKYKGLIDWAKKTGITKNNSVPQNTKSTDKKQNINSIEIEQTKTTPNKATISNSPKKGTWIDYTPQEKADEIFRGENYDKLWAPKRDSAFSNPETAQKVISALENYTGADANDVKAILAREKTFEGKVAKAKQLASDKKIGPYHTILNSIIDNVSLEGNLNIGEEADYLPEPDLNPVYTPNTDFPRYEVPKKKDYWNTAMTAIGSLMPYLRPSDVEDLDSRQLMGEMYALTDHVEPVQSQLYHPELGVPYDISLQDILNENRASTKAAQRLTANNPAAQAMIASQEYGANEKVLGEQFRLNQAMKDKVYSENRNALNQAQLTNLGILDKQYERQETAKSKTKANIQSALNSISSKYLQNQLENRTLATYENLYNYRFDPNYRAWNYNPPRTWNIEGEYDHPLSNIPSDKTVAYIKNEKGEDEAYQLVKIPKSKSKNPNSRNGDILKMVKNL